MVNRPNLSIVIPAYNEEKNIRAGALDSVLDWMNRQDFLTELVIVNDGSQDDTEKLAAHYTPRVITIPHGGKAAGIHAGIHAARGSAVLVTDMDQSTPMEEASALLGWLPYGDMIIGSRGAVREGAPLSRRILASCQIKIRSILLHMDIADTQCGFKLLDRRAALDVISRLVVYNPDRLGRIHGANVNSGWDVEFLYVAQSMGYKVVEVPVTWRHKPTGRVNFARDAYRGVRDLSRIAVTKALGRYNLEKLSKVLES